MNACMDGKMMNDELKKLQRICDFKAHRTI